MSHPNATMKTGAGPILLVLILVMTLLSSTALGQVERQKRQDQVDWFRPEADPQSLRKVLNDELVLDRWIYHDLDAARLQAKKSGKPKRLRHFSRRERRAV